MTTSFSKDISTKLKGLGIYQIAGGIVGIGLTIWLIANQETVPGFFLLLILVALGLNSYSIYCGTLLLKHKANGLNHSLINQYLQLINFSILGYGFQYISGVYLSAGVDLTNSIDFKFNLGISAWQININSDNEVVLINLNFVALYLIIFIDKLKKKIIVEKLDDELSQVGQ